MEKEDNGEYALVIDGFDQGIASDPEKGLNRAYQVSLSVPGEVNVGYPITASTVSGATLTAPIARSTRWFGYGSPGAPSGSPQSFAMLDESGHVFESSSITGTWTYLSNGVSLTGASASDGLIHWEGYLFKTRGANIDYWNGTVWANAWATTLTGSCKHYMYVGTDNVLYITNNNYIAIITLTDPSTPTSFAPANAATYSLIVAKLQLPATDVAQSLAEVGGGNTATSTLLIGGIQNAIYPWDKTSSNFALPIYVGDSYIKNIVSVNQQAFIFPGNMQGRGRIYITNGSQAEEWFKMPDYIFGVQDPYYIWGDAIHHRNKLIFGSFVSNNSGTVQLVSEVWAIDLDTKAFYSVSEISASTAKSNATALISTGNLTTPGLGFIVGWDDDSTGSGIGYSGTAAGTAGSGSIITENINVGSLFQKKTFTQVEYKLRTAMASGDSISIYPYVDNVSTTALSFLPTPGSGVLSGVSNVTFQGAQWLQFQISLQCGNSGKGGQLREIRLR